MSQAPSRPLPATVEEFDEDRGRSKPETRQSAKRPTSHQRRRSDVKMNQQKHPDTASDSGYSSFTHSTSASADANSAATPIRPPSPPKTSIADTNSTSKTIKRRSIRIDSKNVNTAVSPVKESQNTKQPSTKNTHPQCDVHECRVPNCDRCRPSLPADPSPLDRPINIDQAPFNDPRYYYDYPTYQQPATPTYPATTSAYYATAPGHSANPSARPSYGARSPASYHGAYGYSPYYPDATTTGTTLPPSSNQQYSQYAQYYQQPPRYSAGIPQATAYHPLSPIAASPQSPPGYATRPGLPHARTDMMTARRLSQYPPDINTQGLTSATYSYPNTPATLSARLPASRDQAARSPAMYADDRYGYTPGFDDGQSRSRRDSQMPPPVSRRSPTRQEHTSSARLQPPTVSRDRSHSRSGRSRSRTDAGVRTIYYQYSIGDSNGCTDADRPRLDRRESSGRRTRQQSIGTEASGNTRSSAYSSTAGRDVVDDRTDRRTSYTGHRNRQSHESRRPSQEQAAAQAEAYQARVRGSDDPVQVTTENIARARGQSSSSHSRPVIPQSDGYQSRSAISSSSGHKSHRSSKRPSMDGSRISRTDTGEIRIRMEEGTSIRLGDKEIRVENREIVVGQVDARDRDQRRYRDDANTRVSDGYQSRTSGQSRTESEVRGRRHSRARSIIPEERERRR